MWLELLLDPEDEWIRTIYSITNIAKGYAVVYEKDSRKYTSLHRFIMKPPNGMDVDHINGNKLDNRKCNLRIVTRAQNLWNAKSPGTKRDSLPKGVYKHSDPKRKKPYQVKFKWNNSWICVGYFKEVSEAEAAYIKAVEFYRGNFSYHLSRKEVVS